MGQDLKAQDPWVNAAHTCRFGLWALERAKRAMHQSMQAVQADRPGITFMESMALAIVR